MTVFGYDMRKVINIFLDLSVFSLAAIGSLMAFGVGAAWAALGYALSRKNPVAMAAPSALRARGVLIFIYTHSGLPDSAMSFRLSIARWRSRFW